MPIRSSGDPILERFETIRKAGMVYGIRFGPRTEVGLCVDKYYIALIMY